MTEAERNPLKAQLEYYENLKAEHERLQEQLKKKEDENKQLRMALITRDGNLTSKLLAQELKAAQELIGDIQASWEQFGALTSDLEERINKSKSI